MAAAAPTRCLSDLPDDLLQHILLLAPAREAASTAVLSRRLRSLWRASGAVYLDFRSFNPRRNRPAPTGILPPGLFLPCPPPRPLPWSSISWPQPRASSYGRGFSAAHDGVEKALAAAATAAIKRLTFVVKAADDDDDSKTTTHHGRADTPPEHELIAAVVSSPAARRVEELDIEVEGWNKRRSLSFASLPSETLRMLRVRVINCYAALTAAPPRAGFPALAELHLRKCTVCVVDLQPVVDAAPQLATLHLESCCLSEKAGISRTPLVERRYRPVCPAATALVLTDYCFDMDEFRLELDVPRLKSFVYKGDLQLSNRLSLANQLMMPAQNMMIHVADLHLIDDPHASRRGFGVPLPPFSFSFSEFIQNFRNTKLLKLKLDFSMDQIAIAAASIKRKRGQEDEFNCGHFTLFHRLERLDLEAHYSSESKASMPVLARFLHSCPVLRDLRLRLGKDLAPWMWKRFSIDKEARADFDKSVHRFRHRRNPKRSLGREGDCSYEASHIPAILSEQSFSCMESLRRVSLQFCSDKPNCLGAQLAKFFAHKARVLKEMHIDDGSHKLREHMNFSVSEMDC